jgi:hypothetical protein
VKKQPADMRNENGNMPKFSMREPDVHTEARADEGATVESEQPAETVLLSDPRELVMRYGPENACEEA